MKACVTSTRRTGLFAATCAAFLALPISASGISGTYERTFDIGFPGYTGTTALTNFPVLVRLSHILNDFKYEKCKRENGGDLRFSDANGNLLPSEVELWNTNGESLVWVKVPELTKDTVITAHYGSSGPDAMNPTDVWDEHYVGVWHLGATAGATSQPDSTANGRAFQLDANYSDGVAAGVNGAAGFAAAFHQREDGMGAYSISDTGKAFSGFTKLTLEYWTYQDDHAPNGAKDDYYVLRKNNALDSYETKGDGRMSLKIFLQGGNSSGNYINPEDIADTRPPRGVWNHTARVFDGTEDGVAGENTTINRAAYLNGVRSSVSASNPLQGTMVSNGNTLYLGNESPGSAKSYRGAIDEVRISNIARSADWIKATYDTVNDPAFASYDVDYDWRPYAYRFFVTFNGAPANALLLDFPVLVRLSENSPRGFHYADCRMPNGGDLRFCVDDGKPLPCEVEMWNTNGESLVWVKMPELMRGTKLTAYYGREDVPEVSATEVWDEHYLAVWHLDAAAGETTQPDSTAYNHPFGIQAESPDGGVASGTNGVLGLAAATGLRTDGKGCFFLSDKNDNYFFDKFSAFTMEVWTYQDHHDPADSGTRRYILRKGGPVSYDWVLYETATGRIGFQIEALNEGEILPDDSAALPQRAAWNYAAVQWDGTLGECASYLNGTALTLNAAGMVAADWKGIVGQNATGLNLGNFRYNGAAGNNQEGDAFRGLIDEVRISDVMRSPEWIQATHDTIRPGSGFATLSRANKNVRPFQIRLW